MTWIEKLYRTCTVHTCHWYSTLPLTYVHYISIKLAACTTAWMYVLCIYIISHAVSWCMWNVRRRLYIEESWKLKLFIVTNITNCLFEYWFWSTSLHMLYIASGRWINKWLFEHHYYVHLYRGSAVPEASWWVYLCLVCHSDMLANHTYTIGSLYGSLTSQCWYIHIISYSTCVHKLAWINTVCINYTTGEFIV